MKTDTIEATITKTQIADVVHADQTQHETNDALERLLGTYECYGSFNIVRPDFSANANRNVTFERKAA